MSSKQDTLSVIVAELRRRADLKDERAKVFGWCGKLDSARENVVAAETLRAEAKRLQARHGKGGK